MTNIHPTPFELIDTYREFYAAEQAAAQQRMRDPAVLKLTMESMAAEIVKHLPTRHQTSFYDALREAEKAKQLLVAEQNRRAGSAKKTDALQAFITEAVRSDRAITDAGLLKKLNREERRGGDFTMRSTI
jgi:hypothetical protein